MAEFFIDLDNTLNDLAYVCYKKTTGQPPPLDIGYGILPGEILTGLEREYYIDCLCNPEVYKRLRPARGSRRVIKELLKKGNQVTIITHNFLDNLELREAKMQWVWKYFPYYQVSLIFTEDEEHRAELYNGSSSILIDDHSHNLEKWSNVGGVAIARLRPWNIGWSGQYFTHWYMEPTLNLLLNNI